jgi:hypothetical protein
MSVTELKKANGEVLRIIDGEYVIGAGASCQNKVKCPTKIISGGYVVESCKSLKTRFFTITDDKQLVIGVDGVDYESWYSNAIKYVNYNNFLDNVTHKQHKNTDYSSLYFVTLKKGEFRIEDDYIDYYHNSNLPDDLELKKVSGITKEYYNGDITEKTYTDKYALIYITDKAVGKDYLIDEDGNIYTIKA